MKTDLYKEALLEAKKLRKVAEEDAKKSIMESISPYIKKYISEQIDGADGSSQFFFEQEEDEAGLDLAGSTPEGQTATEPETTDPVSGDDLGAGLSDQPLDSPIGANGEEVVGASMPDEEGKITVDFEQLFIGAEEEDPTAPAMDAGAPIAPAGTDSVGNLPTEPAGVEAPAGEEEGLESLETPVEGEEENQGLTPMEAVSYRNFAKSLNEVHKKIKRISGAGRIPGIAQDTLKNKLFSLVEQLDSLQTSGKIDSKKAEINENRLQHLYLKLKDATEHNSYYLENKRDKESMTTTLKEFTAKLFEEASTYAEDGDQEGTNQPTTADGKHAADVSGVSPTVGGPEDIKASEEDGNPGGLTEEMAPGSAGSVDSEALPGTDPEPGSEEHWADGEASLDEEDQDKVIEEALRGLDEEIEAEGHAGFGDTDEEPVVEFEIDDDLIEEAVKQIRKGSIRNKMKGLREGSTGSNPDSWEDADPEGGEDPSQENLKEMDMSYMEEDGAGEEMPGMDDMEDMGPEADEDMEMGDEDDMDSDDFGGDLVLNIDLPDEVEAALASVDISALDDIEVELSDVNLGDDGAEIDSVIAGGEPDVVDMTGVDAEEGSDESDEDEMMEMKNTMKNMAEAIRRLRREKNLSESKLKRAEKIISKHRTQSGQLSAQLKEANLFLAKNVYFTKFLQRGDVSRKNLERVVEYLDRAKTVNEAKTIYSKIKQKLNESASKNLTGSASKVTKSGSAHALNESASRPTAGEQTSTRWQQLAGIKK